MNSFSVYLLYFGSLQNLLNKENVYIYSCMWAREKVLQSVFRCHSLKLAKMDKKCKISPLSPRKKILKKDTYLKHITLLIYKKHCIGIFTFKKLFQPNCHLINELLSTKSFHRPFTVLHYWATLLLHLIFCSDTKIGLIHNIYFCFWRIRVKIAIYLLGYD